MNVHIVTLGCKVNFCESQSVLQMFLQDGFLLSNDILNADVVIVNSCCVTSEAERKCRQKIGHIRSLNSFCIIVLMGCLPQILEEKNSMLDKVDVFIGNKDKVNIVAKVRAFINTNLKNFNVASFEKTETFSYLPVGQTKSRCRTFLKIQDGCNRFCSYCIIPYARGRARSKPLELVFKDALALANIGFKEIVLVGINLSSYGLDIQTDLFEAIQKVCSIASFKRVRLGSLDPDVFTDSFIQKISKIQKLCPHFHLSLQSGSDTILNAMNRPYSTDRYLNIVKQIKKFIPNSTITTDIIVGFPGETEIHFDETLAVLKQAEFLKVHVFAFSQRTGTKAYTMQNQIPKCIKTLRAKNASEVAFQISQNLLQSFVGKIYQVLFEKKDKNGLYEGYTQNYILVKVQSQHPLIGEFLTVQIQYVQNNVCFGKLV